LTRYPGNGVADILYLLEREQLAAWFAFAIAEIAKVEGQRHKASGGKSLS